MNRNMIGSAKGANTTLASATPIRIQRHAPSIAVTGSGMASVIHSTKTAANIALKQLPPDDSLPWVSQKAAPKAIGAKNEKHDEGVLVA